jgi:TP901 family phage tail tape measure protein
MATLTSKLIVELIDRATAPSRAIAGAITRLSAAQGRNAAALANAQTQMIGAVGMLYALGKAITAPTKAAVELESAMADVNKVTNFDAAGLKQFERDLRQLAVSEIPLAVTELTALAAAAAQSGVPETELLDFTRLTAKAAVAWEVTGAEAGESLAKLRSALKLSNQDVALFADAINHLSDNTASSAPDLVDFARRVAAQGEFYGIAKEQTLAFGAAMIGAGAESNVAATSFRAMGRALTKGASAPKAMQRAFTALGLSSVKVAKQMQKDGTQTIVDVMKRIQHLPAHLRSSVMSDLFGDEARAIAPLLGKVEILEDALKLVADRQAYAGSVGREFENRAKTTEYALQRFRSRLREVALVIGSSLLPPLNQALETLGPLALRFAKLAEQYPGLTRAVTLTAAGLLGLRAAGFAARYGLLWMWGGALIVAKGALLGLQGAMKVAAIAAWPLAAAFRALRTATVGYLATAAILGHGGALKMAATSMLGLLNPIRMVTAALRLLKFAVIGTGIGAVLVGIAAAGTWIYNNWSGIKEMFAGIWEGLTGGVAPVMPAIQPVIDGVTWLFDKFTSITGPLDASKESWRSLGVTIGQSLGGAITAVIDKIKSLFGWLTSIPSKITGALGGVGSWLKTPVVSGGASPAVAGARAAGGPVRAGASYLVGERGTELFTPAVSGAIQSASATARMLRAAALASTLAAAPAAAHGGAGGTTMHVDVGGITVNAAPGQSPEDIAQAVERVLSDKLNALSRGAHSDGAY